MECYEKRKKCESYDLANVDKRKAFANECEQMFR